MFSFSGVLASRMTHFNFCGIWSQPLVSQLLQCCACKTVNRASLFLGCVTMSLRTPVSLQLYCGATGDMGDKYLILLDAQPQNHFLACFYICIDSVMDAILGAFYAMAWRKYRMLLQSLYLVSVSWYATSSASFLLLSVVSSSISEPQYSPLSDVFSVRQFFVTRSCWRRA